MEKYKLKVIDIVEEASGIKTYHFEKPADLTWLEGGHTHIGHVGFDEGDLPNKALVRHMSITTLPSENKLGITTKVPGSDSLFKQKLTELKIGDEAIFFKLGSRMYLRRANRPLIFLSMGVGIAAFRPAILAYHKDTSNIASIKNVNVNSSGEFLYRSELEAYADDTYINYWVQSRREFIDLLSELSHEENAIYYIVGSDEFLKDNIKLLLQSGVRKEDILLDKKEEKLKDYFDLDEN